MLRVFLWIGATAALLIITLAGTSARAQWAGDIPGTRPSAEMDTGAIGDQFFHVEWSTVAGRDGHPHLTGYVYNDYEEPAIHVQLRISELDSAGQETGLLVQPVDETVPAKGRAYFDVPVPDRASYRVGVESFEFLELSNG
jgi:hypothetical protein